MRNPGFELRQSVQKLSGLLSIIFFCLSNDHNSPSYLVQRSVHCSCSITTIFSGILFQHNSISIPITFIYNHQFSLRETVEVEALKFYMINTHFTSGKHSHYPNQGERNQSQLCKFSYLSTIILLPISFHLIHLPTYPPVIICHESLGAWILVLERKRWKDNNRFFLFPYFILFSNVL